MITIRPEQLEAFQPAAEGAFEERVIEYLRTEHGKVVIPTSSGATTLAEATEEDLLGMVQQRLERARNYGMTWESSLTAFVVLTFVVAPNFDDQPAISRILNDPSLEPDLRIDALWDETSEEDWEVAATHRDESDNQYPTPTFDEAEIIKRLDDAWWISRDDVAREIVAELSLAEIRILSDTTRQRLVQELAAGYVSKGDEEAIDKIKSAQRSPV